MDVSTNWTKTMEIKASAAKAISDWQAFFASQSMQRAMEIAQADGADQISRAHLDTAALETLEKLKTRDSAEGSRQR